MSLSKSLTLRYLCHLLNNVLGLFYHRHIVLFTISLAKKMNVTSTTAPPHACSHGFLFNDIYFLQLQTRANTSMV